jgi:hypothetical protein
VQPNGTVIVPLQGGGIDVFRSSNGGRSWGKSQVIASIDSPFGVFVVARAPSGTTLKRIDVYDESAAAGGGLRSALQRRCR